MSLEVLKSKPAPVAIQVPNPEPKPTLFNLEKGKEAARANLEEEIKRIVNLPVTQHLTPAQVELVSKHYLSEKAFMKGERLRPEQALAIVHYHDYGGIFCTLGVGRGKTLISFIVATECLNKIVRARQAGDLSRESRILLVVQANLIPKCENDVPFMRSFLKDLPSVYVMKGSNKSRRTMLAKSGRRGIYVCSYHTLSSRDATDVLEAINPACIICDEAQNVAGTKDSARAKRFRNYVNYYRPEVVPLSGTMTRKSVMEYFFLSNAALGDNNFLPNSNHMAEEWASVLDSSAPNMGSFRNDLRPRPGPISYLTNWCAEHFPDTELPPNLVGFRRAFAQRMVTTPGVICSLEEDSVDAGLVFSNNTCEDKESRPGWDKLQEHLDILINDFQTPSGEELACMMNVWGYRYQMEATGFYYDLYWREAQQMADIRKISLAEAEDILDRSKSHHERHKEYQAALRHWLKNCSRPKLDTPALIGLNMKHHGAEYVGANLYMAWKAWKDSFFEGMEIRQSRPVRVCDFKIKAMADDVVANKKHGGIVWFTHTEMGQWAMDELRERGLDPIHCPRGDYANKLLADSAKLKGKIIVASTTAHGTGKDLQHGFFHNYYLQTPVSAATLEQNIGRTHRPGQKADEVQCRFYTSTDFDIAHFNALLNDTAYMQQTTTQKQKLLIGSYTFRPRSIPYTALQEMGACIKNIGRDGHKLLEGIVESADKVWVGEK
jgi:hypothetical protein